MNKTILLSSLASLLVIATSTTSHAALVAYYNLNEASGTLDISDSSGNGYTATQVTPSASTLGASSVTAGTYGAITVDAATAASFGTAADFNAVSGGTDRFDLNTAGATAIAGLLTAPATGTFTIMAWVNASANSNTFFLGTGNGSNNGWKFGLNGQEAFVNAGVVQGLGNTTVTTGAWHHVAFSYNNGLGSFFLDGVAAGTANFANFNEDTVLASIGARPTGTEAFTGKVDELRIFNTALSLAEVQAAAVTAVPEPSVALLGGFGLLGLLRRRRA